MSWFSNTDITICDHLWLNRGKTSKGFFQLEPAILRYCWFLVTGSGLPPGPINDHLSMFFQEHNLPQSSVFLPYPDVAIWQDNRQAIFQCLPAKKEEHLWKLLSLVIIQICLLKIILDIPSNCNITYSEADILQADAVVFHLHKVYTLSAGKLVTQSVSAKSQRYGRHSSASKKAISALGLHNRWKSTKHKPFQRQVKW